MNRILMLLIFPLLLQCSQKEVKYDAKNNSDSLTTLIKSLEEITIDSTKNDKISEEKCSCDWELQQFKYHTDLRFSNNSIAFNLDSLIQWKDNPKRFDIKSLRLKDFDTIPSEMSIFKNVELIYLEAINHKNVQGLEIFSKLRILQAEGERFEIDENSKWIDKIEVIYANKTKFLGLKSFMQMPNLKEIRLSFSGFDVFPTDFEQLNCLTYFQTGAHTFGHIDLAKLNLQNMKCLKYIEFQSWKENIKGVPNGLGSIKTVKINHPNLTKTEKQQLKSISK